MSDDVFQALDRVLKVGEVGVGRSGFSTSLDPRRVSAMIALQFDGAYDLEQRMILVCEGLFDQRCKGLWSPACGMSCPKRAASRAAVRKSLAILSFRRIYPSWSSGMVKELAHH